MIITKDHIEEIFEEINLHAMSRFNDTNNEIEYKAISSTNSLIRLKLLIRLDSESEQDLINRRKLSREFIKIMNDDYKNKVDMEITVKKIKDLFMANK